MKNKDCPICESKSQHERTLYKYELVKCASCAFVYLNLTPKEIEEANASFGSKQSLARYEKSQTIVDRMWHEHLVQLFTKKCGGPGRVLDIGCGNGLLLSAFKKFGWETYGVDLSSWSASYAEKHGFQFFHGTIDQAPFEPDSFDLVINLSTYEHVADPISFVADMIPFIKKEGFGYMAGIPNYGSLSVRTGVSNFHHNRPPRHCNYFTPQTIAAVSQKLSSYDATIRSKTYGIPEMHRFYNWVTSFRKKKPVKKSVMTTKMQNSKKESPFTCFCARAFIFINYYFGRPFQVGDKLEVYIKKK